MVFKDGHLQIVIGTPGGGRVFNVLAQIIIRLLDFQQNPVEAMNAPRFSIRRSQKKLQMEDRFTPELINQLKKFGYEINEHPNYDNYFGGVQLIFYDENTNSYIGVSDPRRNGGALGFE
jgi:gamma-glutamyltranspeptidase/glutathione hydrolase